jgi:predicted Zn-dependent peptidase
MDTHLDKMVDILTDIFMNSEFAEEEVVKERPVIFQEIGMIEDNPEDYVHMLAGATYWGDNPLGRSILGTRENLLGFTSQSIKTFFNRFYQPSHIVVAVAGNVDHERIVGLVGPAFCGIKAGPGFPSRETPTGAPRIKQHQRNLEQVHICLGTRGVSIADPKRYACSLLNTIFGGNMSSRLFQKIREDRGLAYAVYSFISSYEDTGIFGAYVGVQPDDAREAVGLITEEMRRLKKHLVDEAELTDAKNYTKGNLLLASESVDNQMVRLAQNEINFGRYVPLREIIGQIETVTVADIGELAAELFRGDSLALTTLGPLGTAETFENLIRCA